MVRVIPRLTLLLCSLCRAWSLPPYAQQQKQLIDTSTALLRPAVEADLDDIATVLIDAFSPSTFWRYGMPYLKDHQQYLWRCLRKELGSGFAHLHNGTYLNVITVPVAKDEVPNTNEDVKRRTVAMALWGFMSPDAEKQETLGTAAILNNMHAKCSDHLEANMTRVDDFSRQFDAAEKHYIEDFPREQLYLGLLATHPDWDGNGFGARHVLWGLDLAENRSVPATLISSPAGWSLYDELGFESLANITIKTLEWEEDLDLWFEYMRRESE